jgi:hypothetical protein
VRFDGGETGFAFRPGRLLTPADTRTCRLVAQVLNGRDLMVEKDRVVVDGDGRPVVADDARARPTTSVLGRWLLDGAFGEWSYRGDVIRAVARLRDVGIKTAQPVHVFFADQWSDPRPGAQIDPVAGGVHGNPVYGNPVYGNPVYGNPVYGNPVYGSGAPRSGPAAATAGGRVYPNPVFARSRLPDPDEARRYQASGARPSLAVPTNAPTTGPTAAKLVGHVTGHHMERIAQLPPWHQAPVRVAVLDTGLDSAWKGKEGPDDHSDLDDVFDLDSDGYLDPVSGHGTFIAGLIRRLAPDAAITVKQVLSTYGDGDETTIAIALEKLASEEEPAPPHIVSLSFGGYALDEPAVLTGAIARLTEKGIVVVASAGNDATSRAPYPAALGSVVAVAALGRSGPAPFSNHGPWVDACAPGMDVPSWFFAEDGPEQKPVHGYDADRFGGWATWSGTSFAAPVVAATVASTMATMQHPNANNALELLISQPTTFRIPGYGAVVNWAGPTSDQTP